MQRSLKEKFLQMMLQQVVEHLGWLEAMQMRLKYLEFEQSKVTEVLQVQQEIDGMRKK
jgi:hypothetical protein